MRIRDKIITAACRTADSIEWTSYKIKPEETECIQQDTRLTPPPANPDDPRPTLPEHFGEMVEGEITTALPIEELLTRTMELPSTDPSEIADMVAFQVDKISPFPADQLAISHEILLQKEESTLVLMVAAKRSSIDEAGELFKEHGSLIHGIDVRMLGWLKLLRDEDKIPTQGCEIFIINDGIELALIVLHNGLPVAFRTLHADMEDLNILEELTYEIGYTLTMLDAEHDLPTPSSIHFWSIEEIPLPLRTKLAKKTGLSVAHNKLLQLPPLSEGLIRRILSNQQKVELIPPEWVELEQRRILRKKFTIYAGAIAAAWLFILMIFLIVFKTRDIQLAKATERANQITPAANAALENRKKLKTLKVYTNRADSSLECLRDVTNKLPEGDIEFASYNYKKGKGVTLRGTAESDDLVYDYFKKLSDSSLFERLKDDSVNTKTTKGVRRAVFSVALVLPSEEES